MFTSIDRLPRLNPEEQARYRRRWEEGQGTALRDTVLGMIRDGAGEDFLQREFEGGRLGFLEDMLDLKGLKIFDEQFDFPGGDTFEAIDFSYAEFWHSTFNNAVFNCSIAFARVYNCEFRRCIFSFNHCYGTTFDKSRFVECDFVESNTFTNCSFRETSFDNCFMPTRVFFDCSFDQTTRIGASSPSPFRMNRDSFKVDLKNASDIFNGIKDGYRGGGVSDKAREYFFRQMQATTRHNTATKPERWFGFLKEYVAGYGVRPLRVLGIMLGALLLSTIIFSDAVGAADGFILAAGGLFTFGAKADLLTNIHPVYRAIYVATAFAGISLTALFITVLANVWFREQ